MWRSPIGRRRGRRARPSTLPLQARNGWWSFLASTRASVQSLSPLSSVKGSRDSRMRTQRRTSWTFSSAMSSQRRSRISSARSASSRRNGPRRMRASSMSPLRGSSRRGSRSRKRRRRGKEPRTRRLWPRLRREEARANATTQPQSTEERRCARMGVCLGQQLWKYSEAYISRAICPVCLTLAAASCERGFGRERRHTRSLPPTW
mmetsp:Transcript_15162/g.49743  ORF Transcript_15162/g.49743 Transcript_15162/m.49743 type:complete len:205 (+) Transcript_15162:801-1415(+)